MHIILLQYTIIPFKFSIGCYQKLSSVLRYYLMKHYLAIFHPKCSYEAYVVRNIVHNLHTSQISSTLLVKKWEAKKEIYGSFFFSDSNEGAAFAH